MIVEDDAELGAVLVETLEDDWDLTLAADGALALRLIQQRTFDVIVLDRRLPGLDGLAVLTALREQHNPVPVLILIGASSVAEKVAGLNAGANDYLAKPFDLDELAARLRALTRDFTDEGAAVPLGDYTLYPATATLYAPSGRRIHLTQRENDVLTLLASSPADTFSRDRILAGAFTFRDAASTVDTYVHYLRSKTEPGLIITVRGTGYRIGSAPNEEDGESTYLARPPRRSRVCSHCGDGRRIRVGVGPGASCARGQCPDRAAIPAVFTEHSRPTYGPPSRFSTDTRASHRLGVGPILL